jgi:ubiquitin-conjugating enzyme E2 Q
VFFSHYVVGETSWIFCRYLLVSSGSIQQVVEEDGIKTSYLKHDPAHPITLNNKAIQIPLRINNLEAQLEKYKKLYRDPPYDDEDKAVFDYAENVEPPPPPPPKDDWIHNPKWVEPTDYQLLPPPVQASTQATLALQKELRTIINEQNKAHSKRDLGYYISPELMGDNLFQWMVELHSFDPSLPLAKDMKKHGVNSLLFEVSFPLTMMERLPNRLRTDPVPANIPSPASVLPSH